MELTIDPTGSLFEYTGLYVVLNVGVEKTPVVKPIKSQKMLFAKICT
jgi:hypothetical protein